MFSSSTATITDDRLLSRSIAETLNELTEKFLAYLPLIFLVFGFLGFVGNVFTYLQAELRSNTCCIYSLCSSWVDIINLALNAFPNYLAAKFGLFIPWYLSSALCKTNVFLLVFLPHLSINFSLMAIIDRFAATSDLTSPIRRLNQLKATPWAITITMITSALASLYAPIFFDLLFESWCISQQPTTTSILYIVLIGLMQPVLMFIFVLLTYRNVRRSRRRVAGTAVINQQSFRNQFIAMISTQVLVTGFFSLQWIVMYMYFTFSANDVRSADQTAVIFFLFALSNNLYYMNNVKSFYLSILTCRLFRKTFIKSWLKLLPRRYHTHLGMLQPTVSVVTAKHPRRAGQ